MRNNVDAGKAEHFQFSRRNVCRNYRNNMHAKIAGNEPQRICCSTRRRFDNRIDSLKLASADADESRKKKAK